VSADEARSLIATLDPAEIARRIDAAVKYGTSLPAAAKRYGVVGYCWGGGISFDYATKQPGLGAAVVNYGTSPATEILARITAPVLGLYSGNDARVTATVAPAAAEMQRLAKQYEAEVYPGAGHAFLRQQTLQNGANMVATEKAWPRTISFLKQALESPKVSMEAVDAATVDTAAASSHAVECVCRDEEVARVSSAN
jgi:carboxymethylenebutenolidase